MIDPSLLTALDDKKVVQLLDEIEGIMCISPYPDYGPAGTRTGREQQVRDILDLLLLHGAFWKGGPRRHIPPEVRRIVRYTYDQGLANAQQLARRFGTTRMTIWRILHEEDTHGRLETSTDHRDV